VSNPIIKIGTRDSPLAQWQSKQVKQLLFNKHVKSELVLIKSEGDINLVTPLYEMGVQGIFTKTLDAALLNNQIDIAVHSYKDIPTKLADGLVIAAVLKRGNPYDLLVINREKVFSKAELSLVKDENSTFGKKDLSAITTEILKAAFQHSKNGENSTSELPLIIATSSARRKAQLLNRFPNATIENLRGNVNTRIKKLNESNWHAAIFAAAGIERLGFGHVEGVELKWMLPAPAQGSIAIVCRKNDTEILETCKALNHRETEICNAVEKDFLRILMGGCSTPIAAHAKIKNAEIIFNGNVLSVDGTQMATVTIKSAVEKYDGLGVAAAEQILQNGGKAIIDDLKNKEIRNEE
jgi:hydroxymethylbilane synthase